MGGGGRMAIKRKVINYTTYPLIKTSPLYKLLEGLTDEELKAHDVGIAQDIATESYRLENGNIMEYKYKNRRHIPLHTNACMFPIKKEDGIVVGFCKLTGENEWSITRETLHFEYRKDFFGLGRAIKHKKFKDGVIIVTDNPIDAIKGNSVLPSISVLDNSFSYYHAIKLKEMGIKAIMGISNNDELLRDIDINATEVGIRVNNRRKRG